MPPCPVYADRRKPVDPKAAFAAILGRSPYLTSDLLVDADRESFFYWSKEQYGTGINRSQLDVLGGLPGGWKRAIVEGRLKDESAGVFKEVRRKADRRRREHQGLGD